MQPEMTPRVVLVNLPGHILTEEHLEPPLGLVSIASYLQRHALVRPRILDLTAHTFAHARYLFQEKEADIFGFTVYCTNWSFTRELISLARGPDGRKPLILVGGPNPTALPDETLACDGVDIVVTGEGEKAMHSVVTDFAAGRIYHPQKTIIHSERLALSEFPILDRSLVEPPETYRRRCFNQPVVTLEASRGCRCHCFFCNSSVHGRGSRGKVICKDPDLVVAEIKAAQHSGYNIFRFNDDSFVFAAQRSGLIDRLAALNIQYRIFANAKDLTYATVCKLKDSGCFHISIGAESYNPDNLALIGKNTTADELRYGAEQAANAGITVRAYFLVGLPCDTEENLALFMTKAATELPFHEYCLYPLIPYPGTAVWTSPAHLGYQILDRNFETYVQIGIDQKSTFVLRHRNFDEHDVKRWIRNVAAIFEQHGKIASKNSPII